MFALAHRGVQRYRRDGALAVARLAPRYLWDQLIDEGTRFQWRTRLRYAGQRLRYDAPASPWRPLRVDPAVLDTANYELSVERGLGIVRGGDWDLEANNAPLGAYWSVTGLRQRFVEGRPWEDTLYYRRARRRIAERGEFWGYEDVDAFLRERCRYVDELYETIDRDGYRSNAESGHRVPESSFKQKPHQQLEVLVSIGRSGEILFRDGHHRLTIAQILEIDTIPVHVVGRHREWQRIRDAVATAASPRALDADVRSQLDHPDLQAGGSTLRRTMPVSD